MRDEQPVHPPRDMFIATMSDEIKLLYFVLDFHEEPFVIKISRSDNTADLYEKLVETVGKRLGLVFFNIYAVRYASQFTDKYPNSF